LNSACAVFDRPIIILACPRSGSTLLFETLAKAKKLWTIGMESHAVIEHIPEFSTVFNGFKSNELTELDGNQESVDTLKLRFQNELRNQLGLQYNKGINGRIRFLEKTPKNSLRIRFLKKIFPDAKFIHLVRDPKDNISSIIDGWRSKHFITYPNLPGFDNQWSYLLPPNWQDLKGKRIDEIATFQWDICNKTIHNELQQLPDESWHMVHYQDFLDNTVSVIHKLCEFVEIEFDEAWKEKCNSPLPYSQYTLSKPEKYKWQKNKHLLIENMNGISNTVEKINSTLSLYSEYKINNIITP